jgi:hypothetical protein
LKTISKTSFAHKLSEWLFSITRVQTTVGKSHLEASDAVKYYRKERSIKMGNEVGGYIGLTVLGTNTQGYVFVKNYYHYDFK